MGKSGILALFDFIEHAVRDCHEGTSISVCVTNPSETSGCTQVTNCRYKPVVRSADGTRTKGVVIVLKRNLNISTEKTCPDDAGGLAFHCTSVQGKINYT